MFFCRTTNKGKEGLRYFACFVNDADGACIVFPKNEVLGGYFSKDFYKLFNPTDKPILSSSKLKYTVFKSNNS
jgi:hypothetical protein